VIFTIPNLVSVVRIGLVPLFLWLLLASDRPAAAGVLLGVIGATDWVDGFLARRLDQVSEVGKFLDPLADRLAVAAAVIGGWISGALPPWFAAALITREAVVGSGALLMAARRERLEVRYLGKLSTFLLYFSIPAFFVYAGTGGSFFRALAWGSGVPGLALYWLVAVQYIGDMRRIASGRSADVSSPDR
jgi:cardiolipin synthase